jgi:tRNA(Ile2) C34 agmatinyltransferase TiaS
MKQYICPKCDCDIDTKGKEEVVCASCGTTIRVNYDSEYENGKQVDLTSLSIKDQ